MNNKIIKYILLCIVSIMLCGVTLHATGSTATGSTATGDTTEEVTEDVTCFAETQEQKEACEEALKEKIKKEQEAREKNSNLHPIIAGILSADEDVAKVEQKSHMFQYFLEYISAPWYTERFFLNAAGKLIDALVIGIPSLLSSFLEAIKIILTLFLLYLYKITSLSFLSDILQTFLDVILDFVVSTDNIGIKVLLGVAILSFISWLVKNVQTVRLKNIVGMFVQLMLVFIVGSSIITNTNKIINFNDKMVGAVVSSVIGSDNEKDIDMQVKENIFEIMIQQPYLIRNFGYASLDSFQEADDQRYMTRLEGVLKGDDKAFKAEINEHKNGTFVNSAGKGFIGFIISLLSFINAIFLLVIILVFIILPLSLFNVVLIFRPLSVILKTIQAVATLKFGKIVALFTNLVVSYFFIGILRQIISLFLDGYLAMITNVYAINYYLVVVLDLFILLLVILLYKFKEIWLPLLKQFVKGTMAFAKTAINGDNSFMDAMESGVAPIKAGIEMSQSAWENYMQKNQVARTEKQATEDMEKLGTTSPYEVGTRKDASWRAEQERMLEKQQLEEEETKRMERKATYDAEKEAILKEYEAIEDYNPSEIEETTDENHKEILKNIAEIDRFNEVDIVDTQKRTFGEIEIEAEEKERKQVAIQQSYLEKEHAKVEKKALEWEAKREYVQKQQQAIEQAFSDEERELAQYDWISDLAEVELADVDTLPVRKDVKNT